MSIVHRGDRPVLARGPRLPTLQHLVDRANGSEAVTVLRNVFTGRETIPEHTHEVEEILLITAGECIVTVAGLPEVARAGDAVIVTPGTSHAIHHEGEQPCEVIAVLASADAHIATAE
jgi:quercetin dioxygenase-like cupin family protein